MKMAVRVGLFIAYIFGSTSEKITMGRYLDGQVSTVIGSHTHVQMVDEDILPNGTVFLTNAGYDRAELFSYWN